MVKDITMNIKQNIHFIIKTLEANTRVSMVILLQRIVCKNTKDFRKEVAINKGKQLFESDINPIFQCLSENYLNQDAPKLNIAFFDIETDFDPERGFADPSDPFMPITSVSVYLQWLETMVCLGSSS